MRSRNRTLIGSVAWSCVVAMAFAQAGGPDVNPQTGLKNYGRALFGTGVTPRVTVAQPPATPQASPQPEIRQAAASNSDAGGEITADYGVAAGVKTQAIVPAGATADGNNPFAAFELGQQPVTPTAGRPVVQVAAERQPTAPVSPAAALAPTQPVQPQAVKPAPLKPTTGFKLNAAKIGADRPVIAADILGVRNIDGSGAKVEARWERDGDINVGEVCTFRLVVQNIGDAAAGDVTIDATLPEAFEVTNLGPATPTATGFQWNPGKIDAGSVETLTVTAVPQIRGEIELSAVVTTRSATTQNFAVAEPLVEVRVEGPEQVMIGDPAPYTIVVTNPGTGTADDITIEAIIPAGLEHSKGERLAMGIGSLTPGESRVVRLPLTAVDGGEHAVEVVATAGERLRSDAAANVFVVTPSLKLAIDGPGLRYVGRTATYTVTVTNDGSAPNSNVRVTHQLPEGFAFVDADASGRFDEVTRQAKWFLGRLEPGETRTLHLDVSAERLGSFVHQVATISEHGARADATLTTHVDGTPSLTIQIVDLDDPVEVGSETAYEIVVKNEGTKAAGNVAPSCKLPAGVTLVAADGATDYRVEGPLVFFRPIATLRPDQAVKYRVRVRGEEAGNQRFRVRLISDSITEPLIFEELTKFYRD